MRRLLWFVVLCCMFGVLQGLRCMSSNNSIQNIGDIMLGSASKRTEVECRNQSCVVFWVQLQREVILLGQGCSSIPGDTREKNNVHTPSPCPFGPRWTATCTTPLCNKKVLRYDFLKEENGCDDEKSDEKHHNKRPSKKHLNHRDVIRLVAIFVCLVAIFLFVPLVTIPAVRKTKLSESWKFAFRRGSKKVKVDN